MTDILTELIPLTDDEKRNLARLFEPLNDVVVVAVDATEEKTPGGILLPKATNENMMPQTGTVVAHGPGARSPVTGDRVPLSVTVGDRVIFGRYAGNELKYGHLTLKTMREPDILTKVSDDDAVQPETVRVRRRALAEEESKGSKKKAR